MPTITETRLQWILQTLYDTTRVPAFYLKRGIDRHPTLSPELVNQLLSTPVHLKIQLMDYNIQMDKMILMPVSTLEGQGLLVLWPNAQSYVGHVPFAWDQQLNSTTFIEPNDPHQLLSVAIMAHYLLHHEILDRNQVLEDNEHVLNINNHAEGVLELSLLEQRERRLFHKSYLSEKKIFDQVRLGNKHKMLLYLKQHMELNGVYGTLSKHNSLRSKKNLIIAAITLGTRAAIDGGLYAESALTLSDTYIQHIETLSRIDSIHPILHKILGDFTERVAKVHRAHNSKDILLCQEYIFNHLYDDLSLSVLSAHLQISPSYLSRKFKEETGEALRIFIQRQRIEEAKNLIVFSDYRLSEIHTLLNFHDQSYFIKVFRKHTGFTPKEYRNRFVIKPS
ncbi:AraC family transcriptional regulator [Paenibacillus polysaccharolyticus]|uniref:helix-turn-helix domain-containing protein n=1 Tax=Paenibacillus polysaccharolyticus TaxID=582692 RepID=UPI00203D86EC|nr:AraC family transcriptional regulator [Paenibacillus polysaccharolyticus]